MPGDLNHYGFLFGGKMLSWVDEACWIAASLDYPDCRFVTVGMDRVEFHHAVREGVILEIDCTPKAKGKTSVSYEVNVSRGGTKREDVLFSTCITLVNVDERGVKCPVS